MSLNIQQKKELVTSFGFLLKDRDTSLKPEFEGKFMVIDTQDDSSDAWSVVGDDSEALLDDAIDAHEMKRYAHGVLTHKFSLHSPVQDCRFVHDLVTETLIAAEAMLDGAWNVVGKEGIEALGLEVSRKERWGKSRNLIELVLSNDIPQWAHKLIKQ